MAKKEINEKTFELNITNELLNLSKSFLWYLDHSPICHLLSKSTWANFLSQNTLFAEGLTQNQESRPGGGYDVSININNNSLSDKRLLFLQYKSGTDKRFSLNRQSNFYIGKRPPSHIEFNFNDAARKTQHILLRDLANQPEIQSESVMYVFPRITNKSDFQNKISNLIWNSSFIPILDIDAQAKNQHFPLSINSGIKHNFRTSNDGKTSEVNFFFFFFFYNENVLSELIGELICIQIERFLSLIKKQESDLVEFFINIFSDNLDKFIEAELKQLSNKVGLKETITNYISLFGKTVGSEMLIPVAPSKYTTIIPRQGLNLQLNRELDYSTINYQIF